MIYHNQNKDHFPAQTLRERAACTKRFVEINGPEYRMVEVVVDSHHSENASRVMIGRQYVHLRRRNLSYASWFILRAAEVGETVTVKVRCDEVAGKR